MACILVVDDDVELLQVMRDTLEGGGHRVLLADRLKAARETLSKAGVDLLITDILLPDGDGIALIKQLSRERPGLPVIAISGGTPEFPASMTLGLSQAFGAARTLFKPFRPAQVLVAVEAALRSP